MIGRTGRLNVRLGIVIVGLFVMLSVTYGTSESTESSFEDKWAALIKAARQEGELNVLLVGEIGRPEAFLPLAKAFEREFGIKVNQVPGGPFEVGRRLASERRARIYSLDVMTGGPTIQGLFVARVGGTVRLDNWLFHPEVNDPSAWYRGKLPYHGEDPIEAVFSYGANAGNGHIGYNKKLVDPKEFQSHWDIFNPKWKDKIVVFDWNAGGSQMLAYMWMNPALGKKYIEKLPQAALVVADPRAAVDRVVRGTHLLCPFCSTGAVNDAIYAGLPVELMPQIMKEGAQAVVGAYGLFGVNPAPHPNAAKLFSNWFLTRKVQSFIQELTGFDSLREDIPKDKVRPYNRRRKGVDYTIIEEIPGNPQETNRAIKFWNDLVKGRQSK